MSLFLVNWWKSHCPHLQRTNQFCLCNNESNLKVCAPSSIILIINHQHLQSESVRGGGQISNFNLIALMM